MTTQERNKQMYEEYMEMQERVTKKPNCLRHIGEKYGISKQYVYKVVKQLTKVNESAKIGTDNN